MQTFLHTLLLLLITLPVLAQDFSKKEIQKWKKQAQDVTIIRDDYGVPHIYGKTDTDVIFGFLYAQCEDDFERIEENYIRGLGRTAEIEGEGAVFNDLWAKVYNDSTEMVRQYQEMEPWLKEVMDAFADGVNYYLFTHPETNPRLLKRFKPWYTLAYSEGSSEGNVSNQSNVPRRSVAEFFSAQIGQMEEVEEGSKGSNGMAIAPSRTQNGNAMLLINPHVSVYHRLEAHLVSEEGLDVYGAASKGQFFIYHGFNNYCGWMHTSSGTDTQDAFLVKLRDQNGEKSYSYGEEWKEIITKQISVPFVEKDGMRGTRMFEVDYTHFGPIMARDGEFHVAITPLHRAAAELEQQFMTMKTTGLESFREVMSIRSNSTNNTVYADVDGNIAYWNGNFVPKRNPEVNYREPVMGTPGNDWKGLHPLNEIIQVVNPENGWIQNCNSTPYLAAGPDNSPKKVDYPAYMTGHHQNPRAANAMKLLDARNDFTVERFREVAYDNYLQLFDLLLPSLFEAYDALDAANERKETLAGPVELLRRWDRRATIESTEVLLGQAFLENMFRRSGKYLPQDTIFGMNMVSYPQIVVLRERASIADRLGALEEAVTSLESAYNTWKVPLGDIYRFQRISDHPTKYSDEEPSLPSRFVSGMMGSLPAAYYTRSQDSAKEYFAGGNSFIGVIEFGDEINAWTIIGGGQSSHPGSDHYLDQAEMFMKGELKKVHFKKEAVDAHTEESYHPGEK